MVCTKTKDQGWLVERALPGTRFHPAPNKPGRHGGTEAGELRLQGQTSFYNSEFKASLVWGLEVLELGRRKKKGEKKKARGVEATFEGSQGTIVFALLVLHSNIVTLAKASP